MSDPQDSYGWLAGGGEMGARIRAKDWRATPLGAPGAWPQSIKSAVSICLNSRFPMVLWLGPELRLVYNDAYIPFLGDTKHPAMLGAAGREAWAEIWDVIGPMHEEVARGRATSVEHLQMFFARRLPREEVYVTFGYSPIFGDDGRTVEGVFCACTETTDKIVGERRLATLRDVAARSAEHRTVEVACRDAVEVLRGNPLDIPFAAIYLLSEGGASAHRVALTPMPDSVEHFPEQLAVADNGTPWPLGRVAASGKGCQVDGLAGAVGATLAGPRPDPVQSALVLPLAAATPVGPAGFLIVGMSPRRVPDAEYRSFLELVARHIATSIADARAFEAERKRAEALAAIDRAKTAFFSNVSHEFRTPLTLMMSPLEEVLTKPEAEVSWEARGLLEIALRNSLRLQRLVNTLLDFARVEAGRVNASYEPVELAALTAAVASNFRSACERAGLALEVECPPLSMPVYVDREMWEKIVLNLLSNAFKFTLDGSIGVAVRLDDTHARLVVTDTGVGIPAAELPRLFERFHRIEGQRGRTYEGTGIGLALVQELVHLHGGNIAVESRVGNGTTIMVTIPLGHAHLPADKIRAPKTFASMALPAGAFVEEALQWLRSDAEAAYFADTAVDGPMPDSLAVVGDGRARVLLADDNADMRDYVRHLLSAYWQVETVPDGRAALDAARCRKPDLVLADVMMPHVDGMELLAALRRDPELCNVPVILLSARADEEARVEGLRSGADDYLVKPFSARQLVARVASSLALVQRRSYQLASLARLTDLSARLSAKADLPSLHEILDAVMKQQGADFGHIQIVDAERPMLESIAHRGLEPEFLDYVRDLSIEQGMACTTAARLGRRVVIEDVLIDDGFAPHRHVASGAGFRAAQSTPLFERGRGEVVGVMTTYFRDPHRPSDHDLQMTDFYAQQAADVIAFRLSEQRLQRSEGRLKAAADLARLGSCAWNRRTNMVEWDARTREMWGLPADATPSYEVWRSAVHPDDLARVDAALARSIDPQHDGIFESEHRVIGIADGIERWVATRGITTFENGRPASFLGVALDITERKRSEQANLLLIAELQHRTRNLLALVNTISAETLAASSSLAEFSHTFGDRLAALSRVQELLSRGDMQPVAISELVRMEFEALGVSPDGRRLVLEGSEVTLPNASVQILALALHELATNARKYGALAGADGRLVVSWDTRSKNGGRELVFEWNEFCVTSRNGSAHPSRKGFGRTLIEEALPYQLDAQTRLEFGPHGVVCAVTISLDPQRTGTGP